MKYVVEDLCIKYFNGYEYDKNEDHFLIGYFNTDKTQFKDVATGKIVDCERGIDGRLASLMWFCHGGNNMALGYMTGFRACDASVRQNILANYISIVLSKKIVTDKQILKIKKIMNSEIYKAYAKKVKEAEHLNKQKAEKEKYYINKSDREF